MDHVARFAIHNVANVCTRWRFRIGALWKHCCLHSPKNLLYKTSAGHHRLEAVEEARAIWALAQIRDTLLFKVKARSVHRARQSGANMRLRPRDSHQPLRAV